MRKPDKYIFPAIFTFYGSLASAIGIYFPDLKGCVSSADNIDEALYMASDALGVHLSGMEEDGDTIPEPSDPFTLEHELNQLVVPVEVLMFRYREAGQKNINKMCTVPSWLVAEAEHEGINFSRTLQEALMLKLGVKPYPKRRR